MKRNRWRENPTGLEPLAAQARDYAPHMMKTTGSVPPTVIADTAEGYVQPFIAASGLSLQEICQRMQRPEGKTLITPRISTSAFQKSSDLPYPS